LHYHNYETLFLGVGSQEYNSLTTYIQGTISICR
jgi:hypothetical protein